MTFEDFHFLGSKLRRSAFLRDRALWSVVDPVWHKMFARLSRRGLATYINGETFTLDVEFGSPRGRHEPRTYEPEFYRAFAGAVRPGMHVVDVGADIGLFTIGAASRVGHGKVYAFEPNPRRAIRRGPLPRKFAGDPVPSTNDDEGLGLAAR